jgi:hypothetical protein
MKWFRSSIGSEKRGHRLDSTLKYNMAARLILISKSIMKNMNCLSSCSITKRLEEACASPLDCRSSVKFRTKF